MSRLSCDARRGLASAPIISRSPGSARSLGSSLTTWTSTSGGGPNMRSRTRSSAVSSERSQRRAEAVRRCGPTTPRLSAANCRGPIEARVTAPRNTRNTRYPRQIAAAPLKLRLLKCGAYARSYPRQIAAAPLKPGSVRPIDWQSATLSAANCRGPIEAAQDRSLYNARGSRYPRQIAAAPLKQRLMVAHCVPRARTVIRGKLPRPH